MPTPQLLLHSYNFISDDIFFTVYKTLLHESYSTAQCYTTTNTQKTNTKSVIQYIYKVKKQKTCKYNSIYDNVQIMKNVHSSSICHNY